MFRLQKECQKSNHVICFLLKKLVVKPKDKESYDIELKRIFQEANSIKIIVRQQIENAKKDQFNKLVSENLVQNSNGFNFQQIIGQDKAKNLICESLIMPSMRPDIFNGIRSPPKGTQLYGPPGNGKTQLAKAIACECGAKFYNLSASSILSKYVGESEKFLRALFFMANQTQPSIIFIDEVDSILKERSTKEDESARRLKTEFLVQFDGLGSSEDNMIFQICATNRPFDQDSAALRRFQRKILIDVPNLDERALLIQSQLTNIKNNLQMKDIEKLARLLENYSNSDIMAVMKEACMEPLRRISGNFMAIGVDQIKPVTIEDCITATKSIAPCAKLQEIKELRDYSNSNK